MKLSAALQYENQPRSEADWNKIYLNHDGKFFHAYEWSAWLIKAVACTEEYQQQLQPAEGDIHATAYSALWHLRPRHDDIHAE